MASNSASSDCFITNMKSTSALPTASFYKVHVTDKINRSTQETMGFGFDKNPTSHLPTL